ncbi:MAG: hypothetical protein JWN89_212 [Parcubacteria group bacterium]|nr:hypothetical protein [Parcubacteria group bacterium]
MSVSSIRAAEVEFDIAIRTPEGAALFGRNLSAVRPVRGMSMTELGTQSGLTAGHLSRVEGAKAPIGYFSAMKVCEALNVTVSSMLSKDYAQMFAELIETPNATE